VLTPATIYSPHLREQLAPGKDDKTLSCDGTHMITLLGDEPMPQKGWDASRISRLGLGGFIRGPFYLSWPTHADPEASVTTLLSGPTPSAPRSVIEPIAYTTARYVPSMALMSGLINIASETWRSG